MKDLAPDAGRVPAEPGSREPSPAGSAASGFDPSRGASGSIGWVWKGRDGSETTLWYDVAEFTPQAIECTRQLAIKAGYPGHKGGWWNYFVDDAHEWLARRGWTNCKCHPRDSDEHRNGEDAQRLSGEAMPARAEGIAQPDPNSPAL